MFALRANQSSICQPWLGAQPSLSGTGSLGAIGCSVLTSAEFVASPTPKFCQPDRKTWSSLETHSILTPALTLSCRGIH